MGFQIPGPTKGKVQYFVDVLLMDKTKANQVSGFGKLRDH